MYRTDNGIKVAGDEVAWDLGELIEQTRQQLTKLQIEGEEYKSHNTVHSHFC